jgi:hypothetical protein
MFILPHAASYPWAPLSGCYIAVWDGGTKTLVAREEPLLPPIRPANIEAASFHGSHFAFLNETCFEPAVAAAPIFLSALTGPGIVRFDATCFLQALLSHHSLSFSGIVFFGTRASAPGVSPSIPQCIH